MAGQEPICECSVECGEDFIIIKVETLNWIDRDRFSNLTSHLYRRQRRSGLRGDIEPVSIVGSAAQCAEKIEYFFSKGIDTLIIGVADPDPTQLDLFGEKSLAASLKRNSAVSLRLQRFPMGSNPLFVMARAASGEARNLITA